MDKIADPISKNILELVKELGGLAKLQLVYLGIFEVSLSTLLSEPTKKPKRTD